jgi:hypothetical protein
MCAYMTTLAKLDFHICASAVCGVRVTTSARRLSYPGCQISDGSMGIAPRIDRDVAVHHYNTLYVELLITLSFATVTGTGVDTGRTPTASLRSALSWWVS